MSRGVGRGPRGRDPPDGRGEGVPPRGSAAGSRSTSRPRSGGCSTTRPAPSLAHDDELRTEVRQLVVARNERRQRKGQEPLDVDVRGRAPAARAREPRAVSGRAGYTALTEGRNVPTMTPGARERRGPRSPRSRSCSSARAPTSTPRPRSLVVVDDSASIDQDVFNMEAYEGAEWVRIADEVPVDEEQRDALLLDFQTHYHPEKGGGLGERPRAGDEEIDEAELGDDEPRVEGESEPRRRTTNERLHGGQREEAPDFMAQYPGFGEMRFFTEPRSSASRSAFIVAPDAARHRRQGQLRPPPQDPGGGLLRDHGHGPVQARRRRVRGGAGARSASRRRRCARFTTTARARRRSSSSPRRGSTRRQGRGLLAGGLGGRAPFAAGAWRAPWRGMGRGERGRCRKRGTRSRPIASVDYGHIDRRCGSRVPIVTRSAFAAFPLPPTSRRALSTHGVYGSAISPRSQAQEAA